MGGMNDATDDNTQGEALSFEAALRELEGIVASLERGEVSLDAAISAFFSRLSFSTACNWTTGPVAIPARRLHRRHTGRSGPAPPGPSRSAPTPRSNPLR